MLPYWNYIGCNILLYDLPMRHYYVCSVNAVFAYRKMLPKMDILQHFPYFQAILYSVCLDGNLNILYLNINNIAHYAEAGSGGGGRRGRS